MIGTRLKRLTGLLGFDSCQRCIVVANRIDRLELADPGWARANRAWIIEQLDDNADRMATECPEMSARIYRYAGGIPDLVDVAIAGGFEYLVLTAALTANPWRAVRAIKKHVARRRGRRGCC